MTYEINKPEKNWVTYNDYKIAPKAINGILQPVSEDEAKQIAADKKIYEDSADERTLEQIRNIRDNLLNKTDWKIIKASEQGEELSEEFKTWRQNLRDVPQDYKVSDYEKLLEIDEETKELKHSIWKEPKE
jgi:AAA+ ATPase superfamily predicted ATPase